MSNTLDSSFITNYDYCQNLLDQIKYFPDTDLSLTQFDSKGDSSLDESARRWVYLDIISLPKEAAELAKTCSPDTADFSKSFADSLSEMESNFNERFPHYTSAYTFYLSEYADRICSSKEKSGLSDSFTSVLADNTLDSLKIIQSLSDELGREFASNHSHGSDISELVLTSLPTGYYALNPSVDIEVSSAFDFYDLLPQLDSIVLSEYSEELSPEKLRQSLHIADVDVDGATNAFHILSFAVDECCDENHNFNYPKYSQFYQSFRNDLEEILESSHARCSASLSSDSDDELSSSSLLALEPNDLHNALFSNVSHHSSSVSSVKPSRSSVPFSTNEFDDLFDDSENMIELVPEESSVSSLASVLSGIVVTERLTSSELKSFSTALDTIKSITLSHCGELVHDLESSKQNLLHDIYSEELADAFSSALISYEPDYEHFPTMKSFSNKVIGLTDFYIDVTYGSFHSVFTEYFKSHSVDDAIHEFYDHVVHSNERTSPSAVLDDSDVGKKPPASVHGFSK